jgi:hypothetical protein
VLLPQGCAKLEHSNLAAVTGSHHHTDPAAAAAVGPVAALPAACMGAHALVRQAAPSWSTSAARPPQGHNITLTRPFAAAVGPAVDPAAAADGAPPPACKGAQVPGLQAVPS